MARMVPHSKHSHDSKAAEKARGHHAEKGGISGKEGRISGIRKPPGGTLRSIKLAAAAAALAIGLAAAPASAKSINSVSGITDISASFTAPSEPDQYTIQVPEEFAAFPPGQSVRGKIKSLQEPSEKHSQGKGSGEAAIFEITSKDGTYIKVAVGSSSVRIHPFGGYAMELDFSPYNMKNPVPRMELTGGTARLHLLDPQSGTDLTLSFPIGELSIGDVKAKAYREPPASPAANADAVSKNIMGVLTLAERMLEREKPASLQDARDVYGRMGAQMVNKLREEYASAPPEQAVELGRRGQAVIAAVLLRLYVSENEAAVRELDRLRADPSLDKKKLEGFAWKNGVLTEFNKIWPQCAISSGEGD